MPRKTIDQQYRRSHGNQRVFRRGLRMARRWWLPPGKRYSVYRFRGIPKFTIRNRSMKPLLHKGGKP